MPMKDDGKKKPLPKNLEKGKATRFKSGEQAVKSGRKGGIASGEAKRKKKLLKECFDALLEQDYKGKDGQIASGAETLAMTVFQKAQRGDLKAFELVRDTSGQGVVQKIMVAEVDQSTIDEVESMVLGEEEKGDAGSMEGH